MTAHGGWLRVGLLCLLATTAYAGSPAQAQTYPAGPVKFITQMGAGSGTDPAMRIVIDQLGKMWGQQTVLINQPGANGALAARAAHSAAPDGRTLYMAIASTFTVLPQIQSNLPFDVSESTLRGTASAIEREYDGVEVHAVVGDFEHHLDLLPRGGTRVGE